MSCDQILAKGTPCGDDPRWAAAKSTYRYLRLSIVVVVMTLGASLIRQIIKEGCTQGSVSAFYYTPVHSVFIAALGLIGVALIAIRGATPLREALLNMAGFLAPVVAFIPTDRPSSADAARCPIDDAIGVIPKSFIDNNLLTFMIGGAVAMAVVVFLVSRTSTPQVTKTFLHRETVLPAIGAGVTLALLWVWRAQWPASFEKHAHSYSAIAMFALVGLFITSVARGASGHYRITFFGCAVLMAIGIVYGVVRRDRHYTVLVVELIETTGFLVFWIAQSVRLWEVGIPPIAPTPQLTATTN